MAKRLIKESANKAPFAVSVSHSLPRYAAQGAALRANEKCIEPHFGNPLRLLLRCWRALRQLSGDDAYERYLAHHTACHADTAPLSRKEFFRRNQQQKWSGIKRCC